jgi:hypothetical protein
MRCWTLHTRLELLSLIVSLLHCMQNNYLTERSNYIGVLVVSLMAMIMTETMNAAKGRAIAHLGGLGMLQQQDNGKRSRMQRQSRLACASDNIK